MAAQAGVRTFCFALDAAQADSTTSDVLYFDVNGDRDLTNDGKIEAAANTPLARSCPAVRVEAVRSFGDVQLTLQQAGSPSQRFLPCLTEARQPMQSGQQKLLLLVATTVRKATIRIGERAYEVVLRDALSGPNVPAWIRPQAADQPGPGVAVLLGRLQHVDEQFLTLSVDTSGEGLTVTPYQGKFGELGVKRVQGSPQKAGLAARLMRQDGTNFVIGDYYAAELPEQLRLPVGDYRANLWVDYGAVRVSLSSRGFDLRIREEEPVVLAFGDRPVVDFSDPKPDQVFRPGDMIRFRAMLTDQSLGMQIGGLHDPTQSTGQRVIRNPDGTSRSVPVPAMLVPRVTIVDALGKEVASGPMPFG